MLSIAKLRVGQEAYQLSGVAESLDAYYTGAGEAHGEWIGGSAARLGLSGRVATDELRAVIERTLLGPEPEIKILVGLEGWVDRIQP